MDITDYGRLRAMFLTRDDDFAGITRSMDSSNNGTVNAVSRALNQRQIPLGDSMDCHDQSAKLLIVKVLKLIDAYTPCGLSICRSFSDRDEQLTRSASRPPLSADPAQAQFRAEHPIGFTKFGYSGRGSSFEA